MKGAEVAHNNPSDTQTTSEHGQFADMSLEGL